MAYQSNQDTQSAGKGYFPLFSQSASRQVISDKSHPPRYGQCQAGCLSGVKELIKFSKPLTTTASSCQGKSETLELAEDAISCRKI